MVQKIINLDSEQARRLAKLAAATGRQESDVIREGLDMVLAREGESEDWKAAWGAKAAGVRAEPRRPGRLKGVLTAPKGLFDPLPPDLLSLWSGNGQRPEREKTTSPMKASRWPSD